MKSACSTSFSPSLCHLDILKKTKPSLSYRGGDVLKWQARLRRRLRVLLGIPSGKRVPLDVRSLWKRQAADCSIEKIVFTSEPCCDVPAYVCLPHGAKPPFAFAICLQGHSTGMHNSIAVDQNDESKTVPVKPGRDFAVQCMRLGIGALCIEQRSLGERAEKSQAWVAEHSTCHDAAMHALALGRTLVGERVYDVDRALDYLASRGDVNMGAVGVMGNSGGGTVSLFAAAMLLRLAWAMPSGCFCTARDSIMTIFHCDDNYIPGLLPVADLPDVLGLFAPRPVVVVSGDEDKIFPIAGARSEFRRLKAIYAACSASARCHHAIGHGGHRFYPDDAWPVMMKEINRLRREK